MQIVLSTKGKQLAHKPSQRTVWWSSRRWHSVIFIIPELTEEQPLWCRSDESLASVRLFSLTPDQLQEKIQRYWEKPRWQQWLLHIFGALIDQQIEAWSYYQQCLAFREVQQQSPLAEPCLVLATPAELLIDNLGRWISKQEIRFHGALEKRSVHWLKKHFESDLNRYEQKRKKKFLKRLKKELQRLPSDCNQDEVQNQAQAAYQEVEKAMREYLRLWHCHTYASRHQKASAAEQRVEVYTGPSTESTERRQPIILQSTGIGLNSTMVTEWVKARRQDVNDLLAHEPLKDNEIHQLLEGSLTTLISFIEPQLSFYKQLVNKVSLGKVECNTAIHVLERLQFSLVSLYRQGALLFHPDHYQGVGGTLVTHCKEVFVCYQQHLEMVMVQLSEGQATLQKNLAPSEERKRLLEKIIRIYEETASEGRAFNKAMEEKLKEYKENLKEYKENLKEYEENLKEYEEQAKERHAKLKAELQEKINKLSKAVEQLLLSSPSNSQQVDDTAQKHAKH